MKYTDEGRATYRGGLVEHGAHPGGALERAGAHGLGAALAEQARHGRLVREAEAAGVAEVGQLQRHLDVGVGRHAAGLHEALPVVREHEDAQVDVAQQRLRHGVRALHGGPQRRAQLPAQARGRGRGRRHRAARAAARLVPAPAREPVTQHAMDASFVTRHASRVAPKELSLQNLVLLELVLSIKTLTFSIELS